MNYLALQIGQFDLLIIGNGQPADAGSRKVDGSRRPESPCTDDQCLGCQQSFLAGDIHLRQHDLPAVT